jgi:hypothetical protein
LVYNFEVFCYHQQQIPRSGKQLSEIRKTLAADRGMTVSMVHSGASAT